MTRTPPVAVRRQLRREVGFGCPVPECGNPYLYWHHFDPPWREEEHHDPNGMIALCAEHHAKADAGAFSKEQLRGLKAEGSQRAEEIKGKFDWMRRDLLAVVGGNFYLDTPIIFQYKEEPAIWVNRDEDGYLLLNFRMLTTSGEQRVRLEDNFWFPRGEPDDMECPPHGRFLDIRYDNGDWLRVKFLELPSANDFTECYPDSGVLAKGISFPITAVEIHSRVGGTDLEFGPRKTTLPGQNVIKNSLIQGCRVGISLS